MAKLHCCLAGFSAEDALEIEDLAGLLQPQLSTIWAFGPPHADACDLLVCDLDSASGAAAWRDRGLRSTVRAAATSGAAVFGGLILHKPLQAHGPNGLLHLLSEATGRILIPSTNSDPAHPDMAAPDAAASEAAAPIPTSTAPGASPAARPGWLRSLLRAIRGWFGTSAPQTAATEPARTRVPSYPDRPAPEVSQRSADTQAVHTPERRLMGEQVRAAPASVQAGSLAVLPGRRMTSQAVPGMRRGTVVLDGMGCDLLGLLRRSRAASQVIVFRLDGVPAICAAPTNEMCYTLATLKSVFEVPEEALVPAYVTVAQNSYYGRMEVQAGASRHPVSIPGIPLRYLFWVAVLRCGGVDEIASYRDGTFSFSGWPDLANLPHERHHFTWCGLLSHRAMTAAALAKATRHDADEAAIFLAACDELGVLKRKGLPAGLTLSAPAGHGPERAVPVRATMHRLGLARP